MSFSVEALAKIAIDLQSDIGHADRFPRLIATLRQILAAMPRRCCAMKRTSLCRWRSTASPRTCWGGAFPSKGIRAWRRSPAPATWCAFRQIATCRTLMTG
ncbi:Anaerobic nitric oxide reductase transcription regulator norR [Raoultella terrigena]|uniref:Anaerobic nitric oxide reductase transcription regulator norR n=1 Tax=Raoultella terrigena TaxID=577 RepID=A0A4U9D1V9_RAOTE|nr:Anaerobic nitric oxide reductase transcription regulator norR [Raoultella terrigena]